MVDVGDRKLHFVLVPMMAQGHMIPMVDMARLLAGRGVHVSLITTPVNAARIKPLVDRVEKSGLSIQFIALRFPSAEFGLPDGCENVDAIPSREQLKSFLQASATLEQPLTSYLNSHPVSPSCIVSDNFHTWTRAVATEFGVPRFAFNGFGCFSMLVRHIIYYDGFLDDVSDEHEPVAVPGLPDLIMMTRSQAPMNFAGPGFQKIREEMMQVESEADGVLVNSFDELEPSYRDWYERARGKKVLTVGPMLLANRETADMAARGNKASVDEDRCLRWLDSFEAGSVVYVSFGSLARTRFRQLVEIGLGLEASGRPFVWVVKAVEEDFAEVEEWLSEGFEDRTAGRGLVIRGWAPQMVILSHAAVGGFVTHCGWNSVLESAAAGVPMVTWPHFADQFLNEKVVVGVMGVGVAVGVRVPTIWGGGDEGILVMAGEVAVAVERVMDGGEEGEERRERTREVRERARRAVEQGGSSYENLSHLIEYTQTLFP